jgi:hypothetical protein
LLPSPIVLLAGIARVSHLAWPWPPVIMYTSEGTAFHLIKGDEAAPFWTEFRCPKTFASMVGTKVKTAPNSLLNALHVRMKYTTEPGSTTFTENTKGVFKRPSGPRQMTSRPSSDLSTTCGRPPTQAAAMHAKAVAPTHRRIKKGRPLRWAETEGRGSRQR